jgi:hypothetical protein
MWAGCAPVDIGALRLLMKGNLITFVSGDPMIADSNPMSVAAEITEDSCRAAEGGLGVNQPATMPRFSLSDLSTTKSFAPVTP